MVNHVLNFGKYRGTIKFWTSVISFSFVKTGASLRITEPFNQVLLPIEREVPTFVIDSSLATFGNKLFWAIILGSTYSS